MPSKVLPPAPCCLTNDLERIQPCILVAVTELYLCSAYISVKLPLYEDKIWRGIETQKIRQELIVCRKVGMGSFYCYNVVYKTQHHKDAQTQGPRHWRRNRVTLTTAARTSWHRCRVNISLKGGRSHAQVKQLRNKNK